MGERLNVLQGQQSNQTGSPAVAKAELDRVAIDANCRLTLPAVSWLDDFQQALKPAVGGVTGNQLTGLDNFQ